MKADQTKPQSVINWVIHGNAGLTKYLVFLALLIFWVAAGYFSFGFEIAGYSLQQNLLFNFIWLLLLSAGMFCMPMCYKIIVRSEYFPGKRKLIQRQNRLLDALARHAAQMEPDERFYAKQAETAELSKKFKLNVDYNWPTEAEWPQILKNGLAIPFAEARMQYRKNYVFLNPKHPICLVVLGWCALFELFFINAWVKDLTLIWQPGWIQWVIEWMTAHLTLPPLNIDRHFYILDLERTPAEKLFPDEQAFLASNLGDVALVFQFWRTLSFFPIIAALMVLIWHFIEQSMPKLHPKNISGIRSFMWCSVVSLLYIVPALWGGGGILLQDITYKIDMVFSNEMWLKNFRMNATFLFMIFGLQLCVGWFYFWKRVWLSFYDRFIK